jgi:hypothetical protein
MAKSVKVLFLCLSSNHTSLRPAQYLGKLQSSISDQETREGWWEELRAEVTLPLFASSPPDLFSLPTLRSETMQASYAALMLSATLRPVPFMAMSVYWFALGLEQ